MPAPSKKAVLWEDVVRLSETMSQVEVGKVLGVHSATLSKWCREESFQWPRKAGGRPTGEQVEKPCKRCGKIMRLTPSGARLREFCSRDCTNEWQRDLVGPLEVSCPCGKTFSVRPSERERQFCSKGCAARFQGKRQRDPANWITRICQNETCGKTFEIRVSSQSYGKYCSNSCAYRHTKTKKHILVDDAVVLDSGWEALFFGLCAFDKIPCERFDRERGVDPGNGWYAPDFWLPGLNMAVEIKGVEDDGDPAKWVAWRDMTGQRLLVLDRHCLDGLLLASDRERWLLDSASHH